MVKARHTRDEHHDDLVTPPAQEPRLRVDVVAHDERELHFRHPQPFWPDHLRDEAAGGDVPG
jgi:hypothetical protein